MPTFFHSRRDMVSHRGSLTLAIALTAFAGATVATSSAHAQVVNASCASIPEGGISLTPGPTSFDISLEHTPNSVARLTFVLESPDDNELSATLNGTALDNMDTTESNNLAGLKPYYLPLSVSDLVVGTNTVTFAVNVSQSDGVSAIHRLCIAVDNATAPTPRPAEETFCTNNGLGANIANGNNYFGNEIDNNNFESASISIPAGVVGPNMSVGYFATVRANQSNASAVRTFVLRNNNANAGALTNDYTNLNGGDFGVFSHPVTPGDFFGGQTPNIRMTSSMSADVAELCIVLRNNDIVPPDAGPGEVDAGPPDAGPGDVDAGGPGGLDAGVVDSGTPAPDAGPAPSPDPVEPDVVTPEPTPDVTPEATPGVTPGPEVVNPEPRPEGTEPEPGVDGESPFGQGFAVSSCASSTAEDSVPVLFSMLVLLAWGFSRRRRRD